MRTGLTLGKFAPLHKGHQKLIEAGLRETDKMVVIIYDWPQATDVPVPVRAQWIRDLYPEVEIIEAWGGPTELGNAPEVTRQHDAYILHLLNGRNITHFYSSEFYGEHVSRALEAIDRRIDEPRDHIPASGTSIRAHPYELRHFLDPRVYRDLLTWAVFLGAPSTGKTTLCEASAQLFNTVWMPEYGREYWEKHQVERRLTQEQLLEIAQGHRTREDQLACDAREYFFVDTDASTTRAFARYYHGSVSPELNRLADQTSQRYDLFFLCEDDIPYDDTWDRSGAVNRAEMQRQIRADLLQRKIPFISLKGTLNERLKTVSTALERFRKWQSLGESLTGK
jgi:NadR type nicotinamide-nucleotide adenylyltransferase